MLLRGGAEPDPVDLRVLHGRVVEVAPRLEAARGARSPAEAAGIVARAAGRGPVPRVLEGGGFRDSTWAEEPRADLLTAAAPDRPVVLHSLDRHTARLNRPALALVGLADHPTGLVREHEAWQALLRLPPRPADDEDAAREAVAAAHARGVTRVVDFDLEDAWAAWRRRQEAGDGTLGLRVTAVALPQHVPGHAAAGRATGTGDDWLRLGPVELFADGSLGSRTARCLHPYPGTGDRGRQLLDPGALRHAVTSATRAGFRVAVHAIGDEATRDGRAPHRRERGAPAPRGGRDARGGPRGLRGPARPAGRPGRPRRAGRAVLPGTPGDLAAVPVHAVLLDGRWVHGPYEDAATRRRS